MFGEDLNFCNNKGKRSGCESSPFALPSEAIPLNLLPRIIALLRRNLGNQDDIILSPQSQSIILSLLISTHKSDVFRESIKEILMSLVKSIPRNDIVWEVSAQSALTLLIFSV